MTYSKKIEVTQVSDSKYRYREYHTYYGTPEYRAWAGMKGRCLNENKSDYSYYGGRGIKVCERWLKFTNFYADMGKRPTSKHSLDRINVNGDYSIDNCRWATKYEQATNARSNRKFTHQGETFTLTDWARKKGIHKSTLFNRINNQGWTFEKAIAVKPKVGSNQNILKGELIR